MTFFVNIGATNNLHVANDINTVQVLNNNFQNNAFSFNQVTNDEINEIILSLNNSSSNPGDGITTLVIKQCRSVLAPIICDLVNLSLVSGIVPNDLKKSRVTIIFKSGDRTLPGNYRPKSILPVLSKILERVVHSQLTKFLLSRNYFYQK